MDTLINFSKCNLEKVKLNSKKLYYLPENVRAFLIIIIYICDEHKVYILLYFHIKIGKGFL